MCFHFHFHLCYRCYYSATLCCCRGFSLGPWAPPRTIPPHHGHESVFEAEEPLLLGTAMGLRVGVGLISVQRDAALAGIGFPVLPSRSPAFPMDEGYRAPAGDNALFRADATVQRRMLLGKHLSGAYSGGIAWEEGTGANLVAGIGSGITADGRGWHSLGFRLENTVRAPVFEEYIDDSLLRPDERGASTALGGAATGGAKADGSSADPAAEELDDHGFGDDDDDGDDDELAAQIDRLHRSQRLDDGDDHDEHGDDDHADSSASGRGRGRRRVPAALDDVESALAALLASASVSSDGRKASRKLQRDASSAPVPTSAAAAPTATESTVAAAAGSKPMDTDAPSSAPSAPGAAAAAPAVLASGGIGLSGPASLEAAAAARAAAAAAAEAADPDAEADGVSAALSDASAAATATITYGDAWVQAFAAGKGAARSAAATAARASLRSASARARAGDVMHGDSDEASDGADTDSDVAGLSDGGDGGGALVDSDGSGGSGDDSDAAGEGSGLALTRTRRAGAAAGVIMAPRLGRGGRLVFDRVPAAAAGVSGAATAAVFAKAAQHALRVRAKGVARTRARAWLHLVSGLQALLPPALSAAVNLGSVLNLPCLPLRDAAAGGSRSAAAAKAMTSLARAARCKLRPLSTFSLAQGFGYTGDPGDPHALHLAAFAHYAAASGGASGNSASGAAGSTAAGSTHRCRASESAHSHALLHGTAGDVDRAVGLPGSAAGPVASGGLDLAVSAASGTSADVCLSAVSAGGSSVVGSGCAAWASLEGDRPERDKDQRLPGGDASGGGIGPGAAGVRLYGMESALLAPSRFFRVGDEAGPALTAGLAAPGGGIASAAAGGTGAAFGDERPFASVTGNAGSLVKLARLDWDAFVDGAPTDAIMNAGGATGSGTGIGGGSVRGRASTALSASAANAPLPPSLLGVGSKRERVAAAERGSRAAAAGLAVGGSTGAAAAAAAGSHGRAKAHHPLVSVLEGLGHTDVLDALQLDGTAPAPAGGAGGAGKRRRIANAAAPGGSIIDADGQYSQTGALAPASSASSAAADRESVSALASSLFGSVAEIAVGGADEALRPIVATSAAAAAAVARKAALRTLAAGAAASAAATGGTAGGAGGAGTALHMQLYRSGGARDDRGILVAGAHGGGYTRPEPVALLAEMGHPPPGTVITGGVAAPYAPHAPFAQQPAAGTGAGAGAAALPAAGVGADAILRLCSSMARHPGEGVGPILARRIQPNDDRLRAMWSAEAAAVAAAAAPRPLPDGTPGPNNPPMLGSVYPSTAAGGEADDELLLAVYERIKPGVHSSEWQMLANISEDAQLLSYENYSKNDAGGT